MEREPRSHDPADDLWTVLVSFVLYVALLLVLNRVQGEEGAPPISAGGWRLQDLAALVMGVWAVSNLVGYLVWRRRLLWLVVGCAQVLAAGSLYWMREVDWLWLAMTTVAIATWAYAFQVSISAALSGSAREAGEATVPPGEEEEGEAADEGTWYTPPSSEGQER